jgi:hypothetical protein
MVFCSELDSSIFSDHKSVLSLSSMNSRFMILIATGPGNSKKR